MNDMSMPKNEYDAKQLFAESLSESYLSERRYSLEGLEQAHASLHHKAASASRWTMEDAVEQGRVLFAIRHRSGFGRWRTWLDGVGLNFLQAERLIEVAIWWAFFPDTDPETDQSWSPPAAYEALPRIKASVWEQTGYDDTDVCFSALEDGGSGDRDRPREHLSDGGVVDPVPGIKRRMDTLVLELTHQIVDKERVDMLEPVSRMIAELQELVDGGDPYRAAADGE